MTSVIYFVIVRTTRKPTVDDPPKIAGRYTLSLLMKLTLLNLHQSIPALSL